MNDDEKSVASLFTLRASLQREPQLGVDSPPTIEAAQQLSEAELGRLALVLLREMATSNSELAGHMAAIGIGLED